MKSLKLLTAVLFLTSAANASIIVYNVSMSGPNESPTNASPGIGTATVTIDNFANTMTINISSFSGLTGTTTASHIHCCTTDPGLLTAGVATTTPSFAGFPLGVTSGTFFSVLDLTASSSYNPAFVSANGGTPASAEAVLLAGISAGKSYLNIHTSTFGSGEIRGFLIAATPEPGTFVPVGFAALGLGAMLRRRVSRRA